MLVHVKPRRGAKVKPSRPSKHELRLRRWPIQRLVCPFVILVVLTGWIAIAILVRSEREAAESAAVNRAQDRATLLEQHVVKTLQVAALASSHLGHLCLMPGSTQPDTGSIRRPQIDESIVDVAGLSGVTIWDRDGRMLAASGVASSLRESGRPGLPPPGPQDPELAITGPYTLDSSGQKYLRVTRRIIWNGRIEGYVALFFRPYQFLNFPQRTGFEETDIVSVISLDGVTLARREGNSFSSGENLAGKLVMRKQLADPNGTYLGPSSLDGHVRYFSHRRLDGFPIFVTAGVSHAAALASAQRRAIYYYGILGTLSVLGLLMAWLVHREVVFRERKASELAEAAQRLEEAQRIGKIGDWEYDQSSRTLIWCDALCEMYERSRADDHLTIADFLAYLAPEDRPRLEADFEVFLQKGGTHSSEFQVLLPSGKVSHRCISAVGVAGPDGSVVSLHGTDQDITQAHRFRELERRVAHLDRQGAMSMMAGTLAHELNQPLTAASNYITAALRSAGNVSGSAAEFVTNGMRHALEQINDAAEIIRRARKIVQIEVDKTRTASVRDVIASTIALLKASGLEGTKAIQVQCKRGIPDALISRIQLQQVLINLLKNALEAAPSHDPRILIRVGRFDPSLLRIEISDNGPGFPDAIDAFSPFYTDKVSGLGLGLSISRTIIEHHSGKLWIDKSEPGETSIVILLPLAEPGEARDPPDSALHATSVPSPPAPLQQRGRAG